MVKKETYYTDDMLIKPGLSNETVRMEKGCAEFFVYRADGAEPAGMLLTVGYCNGPVEIELRQEFSPLEMAELARKILGMLEGDR